MRASSVKGGGHPSRSGSSLLQKVYIESKSESLLIINITRPEESDRKRESEIPT